MPRRKKPTTNHLRSTRWYLDSISKRVGELEPTSQALYQQLVQIYSADVRATVDGVAGLDTAARKAYLAPYLTFAKALKKAHNPKKRHYSAPPQGTMRIFARTIDGLLGWLKNRHRYKPGELNPPATDDALLAFQEYLRAATGKPDFFLPAHFVDSYRICNGARDSLRMHSGTGLRLFSLDEIKVHHQELVTKHSRPELIPISDDGAGNYFILLGGEVYDLNHEDGALVAMAPSLNAILAKAHKPRRR